jgi:hypothetical protein
MGDFRRKIKLQICPNPKNLDDFKKKIPGKCHHFFGNFPKGGSLHHVAWNFSFKQNDIFSPPKEN